jgi:hypothetical protein
LQLRRITGNVEVRPANVTQANGIWWGLLHTRLPPLFFVDTFVHNSHSNENYEQHDKNDTFSRKRKNVPDRLLRVRWINYSFFPRFPHRSIFGKPQKTINYDKTTTAPMMPFSKTIDQILTMFCENLGIFSKYLVKILTMYFVAILFREETKCQGKT